MGAAVANNYAETLGLISRLKMNTQGPREASWAAQVFPRCGEANTGTNAKVGRT